MTDHRYSEQQEQKLSGIVVRILYMAAVTLAVVLGGYVFIENDELGKLTQDSFSSKALMMSGQVVALIFANYFFALSGKNLTDWKTEASIILCSIFTCLSLVGPYLFLRQVGVESPPWWKFFSSDQPIMDMQPLFFFGVIPAISFFIYAIHRIRKYHSGRLSRDS